MTITEAGLEVRTRKSRSAAESEARIVGIRGAAIPTMGAVDRRRSQLWTLAFSGLVCLSASIAFLTSSNSLHLGLANTVQFRVGTVVLVIALAAYVMDKERHLRKLSQMLVSERVHAEAMAERLKELTNLGEAATAMNSVLLIEEVLKLILTSAYGLLQAVGGSIMLLEDVDSLAIVCAIGQATTDGSRTKVGEGVAGSVARSRAPVVIQGTGAGGSGVAAASAVGVPLIHRGELFGVLNLTGATGRVFTEYDLLSVSLFAGHAAIAIANARLHEAENERQARLSQAR